MRCVRLCIVQCMKVYHWYWEKNNRNCFFILDWCICCNVTLYKFFYNSEQSWVHFFFSNQTLIYGGLPCQNFFVFLYLFVCNVLPIFCYLHNEAILFLDTDRVWNKMLYLYLYPSLWYLNPCIVFFVTVGKIAEKKILTSLKAKIERSAFYKSIFLRNCSMKLWGLQITKNVFSFALKCL